MGEKAVIILFDGHNSYPNDGKQLINALKLIFNPLPSFNVMTLPLMQIDIICLIVENVFDVLCIFKFSFLAGSCTHC